MSDNANLNDPIIADSDIETDGPTESQDDRDAGSAHGQDSGDEPTEESDDRDRGGEGTKDTGDEA